MLIRSQIVPPKKEQTISELFHVIDFALSCLLTAHVQPHHLCSPLGQPGNEKYIIIKEKEKVDDKINRRKPGQKSMGETTEKLSRCRLLDFKGW